MKRKKILMICLIFGSGVITGIVCLHYSFIFYLKQSILNILNEEQWPSDFVVVKIPCSYDNQTQNAYFYTSRQNKKMPLIVSLHPWRSDYQTTDVFASMIKTEDWNYIHPDFRGQNDNPDACMSDAVISDIDDAIAYAIKNGNVDEKNIIVMGVSGGGMAALGVYMRSRYYIRYTMAWCPIADLEAWYYQSQYDDTIYWRHIAQATGSGTVLNTDEARRRSPLFMNLHQKDFGEIEIYAGINDGYTGTVSILHSLLFYNKLVLNLDTSIGGGYYDDGIISDKDIIILLSRSVKNTSTEYIEGRQILYKKSYQNVSLFIFDGTHEMLSEYAFIRIKEICLQ
jgi:hypothetical protein